MAHKESMQDAKQAAKNGMPLSPGPKNKHPHPHRHSGRHGSRHSSKK